jgi:deoxyribodipyrimidine photo-lyase
VVLWFRRDLRVSDHPALAAAVEAAGRAPVVPVFLLDPRASRGAGPNRLRFLYGSLAELSQRLGGHLTLGQVPDDRTDGVARALDRLCAEVGAELVVATGETTPYGRRRDLQVRAFLAEQGRQIRFIGSPYVVTPGRILRPATGPYRVFTAYHRAWLDRSERGPHPTPAVGDFQLASVASEVALPSGGAAVPVSARTAVGGEAPGLWSGLPLEAAPRSISAGQEAAESRLDRFCRVNLVDYHRTRDRPDLDATSHLSADLHFGTLHPRTVLAAARRCGPSGGLVRFVAEIGWREFYADVLWHNPASAWRSLNPVGQRVTVDSGPAAVARFQAWARGETGYRLVDAGMRQLLEEGWMHNRARMVTASFLVKDLHLDWRWGARWFLWHLRDGDVASNNHGWQWVAGTGTDAAPYHRIFNPDRQADRFDPDRRYSEAYSSGRPAQPIVDHDAERVEALARWRSAGNAPDHGS